MPCSVSSHNRHVMLLSANLVLCRLLGLSVALAAYCGEIVRRGKAGKEVVTKSSLRNTLTILSSLLRHALATSKVLLKWLKSHGSGKTAAKVNDAWMYTLSEAELLSESPSRSTRI